MLPGTIPGTGSLLALDGTASDVGLLNAARWLPYLTFGLVVGALVDGRRRLPLMVRTDLVQAFLLLLVPLLWWLDVLSLPVLLVRNLTTWIRTCI